MRIWPGLCACALGAGFFVGTPSAASAQFYVRSPDVTKGETAIEEHGAIYAGPGEEERRRQSHEVEFKYGLTDRWELIVEGFFRQDIGQSIEAREFEIGGQYEIIERHGDGLGLFVAQLVSELLRVDAVVGVGGVTVLAVFVLVFISFIAGLVASTNAGKRPLQPNNIVSSKTYWPSIFAHRAKPAPWNHSGIMRRGNTAKRRGNLGRSHQLTN